MARKRGFRIWLVFGVSIALTGCDLTGASSGLFKGSSTSTVSTTASNPSSNPTPVPLSSSLAPGAINGGIVASGFSAVHLVNPSYGPSHAPVQGLVKIGTAEYATGFLRSDGKILAATGTPTPLVTLNPAGVTFVDYSGGLHQSIAIDSTGHAWTWGETENGVSGTGTDGASASVLQEVLTDVNGQDFNDLVSVKAAGWQGPTYSGMMDAALKSDGTLWVWGNCMNGITGDGTAGRAISRPTQVPFPSGVKIEKFVLGGEIALALAADGSVWSWGESGGYKLAATLGRSIPDNGMSPGQVLGLPTNIADIVSGGNFSYVLTTTGELYGWGQDGRKLGMVGTGTLTLPTATNMQSLLNLRAPVKTIATNNETTHVILTDGSLWGWGDDAQGEIGDGQELDYSQPNPRTQADYAWDWGNNQLSVIKPVQIAPQITNWKELYTNAAYVFYVFAVTDDGDVYSWGRNKTGDLMNGIVGAMPDIEAKYPNSWDVLVPQHVNPLETQKNAKSTSPYCLVYPTQSPCSEFNNALNGQ